MYNRKNEASKSKPYFAISLDPIHIGTGGYRLGRVDNTIVREPGTDIPKIPGASIEGTTRTYAYYKSADAQKGCALGKENPCGRCDVCITFGYTGCEEEDRLESLHGMAQFSDARILFFPIHSLIGPVWVTTRRRLKALNESKNFVDFDNIQSPDQKEEIVGSKYIIEEHSSLERLNLGWLYFPFKKEDSYSYAHNDFTREDIADVGIPEEILKRTVVIHSDIFDKIVNSNLEVRTSVSINPETGAAESGALFTYEAIPRATILWFDVIVRDPSNFKLPDDSKITSRKEIFGVVEKGFKLFKHLGAGGMTTRGFGRLEIPVNKEGETNGERNEEA